MAVDLSGLGPARAVVIHLPRRADREANVARIAARTGIPTTVLDAVDGRLNPPPRWWLGTAGAWACRLSHMAALAHAKDVEAVLVLEDDADLPADFPDRLAELVDRLPQDWEVVMLGGQHAGLSRTYVAPGLLRCYRTLRTHAYLARWRGDLVRGIAASAVRCWDSDLAVTLGDRRRTYAPDPFLVGLIDSPSDVAGAS